ncbi:MAG: STAS domain-containing protein [Sedimentisphaerales bacterium]|nr:STAS domain-containing protein [Sedimentisphaerales bacterium]
MTQPELLTVETHGAATVVGFTQGNLLDAYHIDQVNRELSTLVQKRQIHRLIVDISTAKMISSKALSVFLNLHHQLKEQDGVFALCGIDPMLYRVFKVTRLQDVFTFYPNVEAAIKDLAE